MLLSLGERASTIVTSNRLIEDWARLLGDVVVATPFLDRLLHHGHLLKFDDKSWRQKWPPGPRPEPNEEHTNQNNP